METIFLPEAEDELAELEARSVDEAIAMRNAIRKLINEGPRLPAPHSSQVKGERNKRELRPRQGRSRWRAFYRRIRDTMVIGAIGPEAKVDRRGFDQAVRRANDRLDAFEREMS